MSTEAEELHRIIGASVRDMLDASGLRPLRLAKFASKMVGPYRGPELIEVLSG
jgi:hypothetical protein